MKNIGLFEAKTRFSEICEHVARTNESVTITRRGRPVVRIVPIPESEPSILERWLEHRAQHPDDPDEDFELPTRSRDKGRVRF